MNRLILVRHGQSEHHVLGLTGGWTDTPLTPFGRVQAQAGAERCRQLVTDESPVCLYTSDLLRAFQTAAYVADALGTEYRLDPALREINNGIAINMTWQEADKIELPATEPEWDWIPYLEAESRGMMTERVYRGMDRIAEECPSTAMIVSHGIAGAAIVQWWLRRNDPVRQSFSFALDAASITELGINAQKRRTIVRLNDTAHLARLPAL